MKNYEFKTVRIHVCEREHNALLYSFEKEMEKLIYPFLDEGWEIIDKIKNKAVFGGYEINVFYTLSRKKINKNLIIE